MAAFIPAAISGLGALAGLFGKKQQQTGTLDQTTTSTPSYDPQSLDFRNFLINSFQNQASPDALNNWNNSYLTAGKSNIMNNNKLVSDNLDNLFASRGLSRTTAGGTGLAMNSFMNAQRLSDFMNNAPQAESAHAMSVLSPAASFFSNIPYGTTQHTNAKTVGNFTGGGGVGGAVQGGATSLAGVLGQIFGQRLASQG